MQDDSCDLVFDLTAGTCDDGHLRVVHFHIGDNDEEMESTDFVLGVRAIVEEIPETQRLKSSCWTQVLMPQSFHLASLELECHRAQRGPKLCDAQRKQTIENMRLVEIRFVILKERVAISSKVTQPVLCFGHFLEHGFGIDGVEQALTHSNGSISIRLQMHNKNTGVLGHVRVLQALPEPDNFQAISERLKLR